jgi:hypothetical protein
METRPATHAPSSRVAHALASFLDRVVERHRRLQPETNVAALAKRLQDRLAPRVMTVQATTLMRSFDVLMSARSVCQAVVDAGDDVVGGAVQ